MSSTVSENLEVSVRENCLGNFGANFAARFLECFEPTSVSVYG
jgi:hypothetical protein